MGCVIMTMIEKAMFLLYVTTPETETKSHKSIHYLIVDESISIFTNALVNVNLDHMVFRIHNHLNYSISNFTMFEIYSVVL